MTQKTMEKLSGLTKKSFVNKNLDRAADAALICHVAKRVIEGLFKKSFLKEIEIISFRDGTLFIATSSPVYSQEIKLKEKNILDALNRDLRSNVVKKIRFRSARISKF